MNKKQRGFVQALAPAISTAMRACAQCRDRDASTIPGLAVRPRASAAAPAEIMIYGQIGGGFWSDGINASDVAAVLRDIGAGPLRVRINSPGGDVFQGTAIYSLLAQHAGHVDVDVDGLAASAASIIMLAGDTIRAPKHAFVMIHDAMTFTYGNQDTHIGNGELLGQVSGVLAEMYADRAGEDTEHWRTKMTENGEDGTWYTGTEAHAAGLVDEITVITKGEDAEDEQVAARLDGWSHHLAPRALAFLEQHRPAPEPDNETPAPLAWDNRTFADIMKGVFA